jgi:hypothetical protein
MLGEMLGFLFSSFGQFIAMVTPFMVGLGLLGAFLIIFVLSKVMQLLSVIVGFELGEITDGIVESSARKAFNKAEGSKKFEAYKKVKSFGDYAKHRASRSMRRHSGR